MMVLRVWHDGPTCMAGWSSCICMVEWSHMVVLVCGMVVLRV